MSDRSLGFILILIIGCVIGLSGLHPKSLLRKHFPLYPRIDVTFREQEDASTLVSVRNAGFISARDAIVQIAGATGSVAATTPADTAGPPHTRPETEIVRIQATESSEQLTCKVRRIVYASDKIISAPDVLAAKYRTLLLMCDRLGPREEWEARVVHDPTPSALNVHVSFSWKGLLGNPKFTRLETTVAPSRPRNRAGGAQRTSP